VTDSAASTSTSGSSSPAGSLRASESFRRLLLAWPLFFLICMGLGYPTLNRYDPRALEGLSDTAVYYQLVIGGPKSVDRNYMGNRILVPLVAKPFYWFARSYLKRWEPVFFGLLVANSLFCATAACFLVRIGDRVIGDPGVALLSGTLYLLNFAISNLQLAGLIDSAEACFMLAVTWALLTGRWALLPLWGVLGGLAKETFVPFALVFTTVWWVIEAGHSSARRARAAWATAMGVASILTLIILHSITAGHMVWPWNIVAQANARVNIFAALWRSVSNHGYWYVFGWLLPLGLWRLGRLPRPWVSASIITALVALLFGAWKDMLGTVARPMFDVTGPVLCLSVALLLSRHSEAKSSSEQV
jgi:hypothetical protein